VEVTPDAFARWVREKPGEALLSDGIDPVAAIASVRDQADAQRALAGRLFGAWAAEVARRGVSPSPPTRP
jgi:hypothetical protein